MDDDFLNGSFDDAALELSQALAICTGGCSGPVVGRLHVGLGTVDAVAKGDLAAAQDHFVAALRADRGARLLSVARGPEMEERAFEAAKRIVQGQP